MIISKILGGLGNQMFQYAIAKSIANKNKDVFKLDISGFDTYKLHNGYRLNCFNIDETIATKDDVISLKGNENLFFKLLKKLKVHKVKTYYKEKEITVFDDYVFKYEDIYLDGYWQNELYFNNVRDDLLKEFTIKKELSQKMTLLLQKIKASESVSVHVRRGDYLNHPDVGVLDVQYYKSAVKYIKGKTKSPVFFIFSNDLDWCKKNFSFIEDCVFVEHGTSDIEDITLMSNCCHNIIANSSFSWWGAWLNNNNNNIIIAPEKWMAINPKNYKWIPVRWVKL